MAVETFVWAPDDEASCDSMLKTRKSRFGDGYVQVSSDGLNAEEESWSLSFGGLASEVKPILDFLRSHRGSKSFLWTPPDAALGLYRCDTFRQQKKPAGVVVISATFERAYQP
ncbi:phage tail protein [Pseudomonas cannabina]|uniref:phage tail protein n=1 Tax=Pseudomonas cannabina TaxID=86840 RepID=UPI001904F3BD|nr:phage tail protein [Pseudomonas cannabina]QQN20995.1 phage tail protein [Pseudomonas cannabina pv. alisalensis]QQN21246.1 phage tail protein [Pseudomonas cannabina pv. alisalensis]